MAYLSKEYFLNEPTRIVGLDSTTGGVENDFAQDMKNRIERYINIYEPKFLRAMIGNDYEALLAANEDLKNSIFNEDSYISPAANYVYFKMWCDMVAENTMTGDKMITASGATVAINQAKLTNVWNNMVSSIWDILLPTEVDVEPNFTSEIFEEIPLQGI